MVRVRRCDGRSAKSAISSGGFNDLLCGPGAGVFEYEGTAGPTNCPTKTASFASIRTAEGIHIGLRSPKEVAFDEYGNAFSVDNNSDQGDKARIVEVMKRADSGWSMEQQALHSHHRQIALEQQPRRKLHCRGSQVLKF